MHFGFSYIGLIFLVMLMVPNLPVIAFMLLAVYGRNIVLGISVIILGIGHIGIHLMHKREAERNKSGS